MMAHFSDHGKRHNLGYVLGYRWLESVRQRFNMVDILVRMISTFGYHTQVFESIPGAFGRLLQTSSLDLLYFYSLGPLTSLTGGVSDDNDRSQMCRLQFRF